MVGFLGRNSTTFMFKLSIFIERRRSYRYSDWLKVKDKVHALEACYVIYLSFHFNKRMYSHPNGKATRVSCSRRGFKPQRCHFSHFSHFFSFFCYKQAAPGPLCWAFHFLLALTPCLTFSPLAHYFLYYFIFFFILFSFHIFFYYFHYYYYFY